MRHFDFGHLVHGVFLLAAALIFPELAGAGSELTVVVSPSASPRVIYGSDRLKEALSKIGVAASARNGVSIPSQRAIVVGSGADDPLIQKAFAVQPLKAPSGEEAFLITSELGKNRIAVIGGGDSGALYGCLELAERIEQAGRIPKHIYLADQPKLRLRGTNLFWMKQGNYDWPVTPENFPWFFDRTLMTRHLDILVQNRFNTIYFWNGHPFSFFLRLPKYPEAQSLSDQDLERNIKYFNWFTAEADKRGIWVIFHFYNIHVPKSFAEAHKAEGVQVANRESTPLLASYTRYAITEFIKNYPSVGLLVCAGEALSVNQEEWIRDVIVPGVKDAEKEPPILVREWTIDRQRFKDIVVPAYRNLYTMMKHNVEMIVSPHPDPRNEDWTRLGRHHIVNVHENADVKPLRWGSPAFVREMVQHWLEIGVSGAHVYPMVSWDWPYALDKVEPKLLTLDRDWIWLQAMGRYCWNPDRDESQEKEYWIGQLRERFGTREAAEHLLAYYETSGPVLPGLQNLMSIFNMNWNPTIVAREQMLGAMLNSDRQNGLDNPLSRPHDRLTLAKYAAKFGGDIAELGKRPAMSVKEYVASLDDPEGEAARRRAMTPPRLLEILADDAAQGLSDAREAARLATSNRDEAARFVSDALILQQIVAFYRDKIAAAVSRGLYDRNHRPEDLQAMMSYLEKSVDDYQRFTEKAEPSYRQATDMVRYLNWDHATKVFRNELAFYKDEMECLKTNTADVLFLGVNGPFEDASNAFHWAVVEAAKGRGMRTQSYLITPEMIDRAQLIVVYNLTDPFVQANRERLRAWVEHGGHLLFWDEQARASGLGGLVEGLTFNGPSDERVLISRDPRSIEIRLSDAENPLLGASRGVKLDKPAPAIIPNNVRNMSPDWRVLAYTVVSNKDYGYLFRELAGSDWVARADPRTCPLILERSLGTGSIALLQLGRWQIDNEVHHDFMKSFASNVLDWARR